MRILKLSVLLLLSISLLVNITSAQNKIAGFKVLAEGFQSEVDKPFMFVACSPETYSALFTVVKDLPDASTIDFSKNAVVAGFAGTRPTGGWSVDITGSARSPVIVINAPRKGMMTNQMITAPFKIVLVPVSLNQNLSIQFSPANAGKLNIDKYRLSKGKFSFTGGLAGRHQEFTASGTINLLTYGDLVTFIFDLQGKGSAANRRLSDTASGTLKNGEINLAKVDAGSFSEIPRPNFSITGNLNDSKLTLSFAPLPTTVTDSYTPQGNLEALKTK